MENKRYSIQTGHKGDMFFIMEKSDRVSRDLIASIHYSFESAKETLKYMNEIENKHNDS